MLSGKVDTSVLEARAAHCLTRSFGGLDLGWAFTVAPNPAESILCTFLVLNTSLEIRKRHGDAEEWCPPQTAELDSPYFTL